MNRSIADIWFPIDGFVAESRLSPDNGPEAGGEVLHTRARSSAPDDRRVPHGGTRGSGAVVPVGRLFDVADGPKGWDATSGYGVREAGESAFVVATSAPPDPVRTAHIDWTLVTTGQSDAVITARERAEAAPSDSGKDLDAILTCGGAAIGSVPGARHRAGRRADAAPRTHPAGRRNTPVHRRGAALAGAVEREFDIDRDVPDLRRLPVIR
ncbi:dihydrofolate reductase [Streptomyces sp. NPDC048392]|uniref:dihydrofolate reductase n=1 Tax=Streptomyces sp. NPDC048392 TaxID=3365543 RepID=UPI0037242F80